MPDLTNEEQDAWFRERHHESCDETPVTSSDVDLVGEFRRAAAESLHRGDQESCEWALAKMGEEERKRAERRNWIVGVPVGIVMMCAGVVVDVLGGAPQAGGVIALAGALLILHVFGVDAQLVRELAGLAPGRKTDEER